MKKSLQVLLHMFMTLLVSSCLFTRAKGFLSGTAGQAPGTRTISLKASPVPGSSLPAPTGSVIVQPQVTATLTLSPDYQPESTQAGEQTYLDPAGWYAVNLPADWAPGKTPGSFSGSSGFMETGYLTEMGYLGNSFQACQWLANIDFQDTYQVSWPSLIPGGCQLLSLPGVEPESVMDVILNPAGDGSHRYLYLRSDLENHDRIVSTFAWLQPVEGVPARELPLRPVDQDFWGRTEHVPSGLKITEYPLPPEGQDADPGEIIMLDYVPEEAWPDWDSSGRVYQPDTLESVNQSLEPFGYQLRIGAENYLYDLYRDDVELIRNIFRLPDVYLGQSGAQAQVAFLVYSIHDLKEPFYKSGNCTSYLVLEDGVRTWEDLPPNPNLEWSRAQWVDGELLLLGLGENIDLQIRNETYQLVFSFQTYFATHVPVQRFSSFEDHWILEVSDFLIEDGVILNEQLGLEAAYGWRNLEGDPFYFFQKGTRSGISYGGEFLSIYYDQIPHGYCCGLGLNNPISFENTVRFFGKRDGVWYYVVAEGAREE